MSVYGTEGMLVACDAWGVDFDKLNDIAELYSVMDLGARYSGANVLGDMSHKFHPNGVTVLLLLSESHFSIHTYPEEGFAAIDCFTCGQNCDPRVALQYLLNYLQPDRVDIELINRGTKKGLVSS